jgi:hypothetical protein
VSEEMNKGDEGSQTFDDVQRHFNLHEKQGDDDE